MGGVSSRGALSSIDPARMRKQENKTLDQDTARLRAAFLEERNTFLHNVEEAYRMHAGMAELRLQFKTQRDIIYAAFRKRTALRTAINSQLEAMERPLIGRYRPDHQEAPSRLPPRPGGIEALPYEQLDQFLTALSALEEKSGWIDELEYTLQREDLERLKRWMLDRKIGPPPSSN